MSDFREMVVDALDKHIASGAVEAAIEKHVGITVEKILEENLRSYSEFGKAIGEAIKNALKVNVDDLGIPGYNDLLLKIVRRQTTGRLEEILQEQVKEQLESLLESPPAEIKLTKFVEQFIEWADDQYEPPESNEITLIIEKSRTGSQEYFDVWLDKNADQSAHECEFMFRCRENGSVWMVRVDGVDFEKKLFVGPLFGFDQTLFAMKVAGTKLILDEDPHDIDLSYPSRDI